ncbi:hypothetical protein F6Y02_43380 [Bacillus megaterium]|nr:hypothetical protein [Priestia megaterium]
MVLAKSVKEYHPDAKFIICLIEEEIPSTAREFRYFDEIILAKDLGIPNFYSFIFKHNAIEASTAVKGNLFLYLLNRYIDYNKFIYLDPDIYVMDRLTELDSLLDEHSIVLTPHLLTPEDKDDMIAIKGNEIQILQKDYSIWGFLLFQETLMLKGLSYGGGIDSCNFVMMTLQMAFYRSKMGRFISLFL